MTATITGECMCHGTVISGTVGTVAQPKPYMHTDVLTGIRVRCVAVLDGGVHDIPLQWPKGIQRCTTEATVITEASP